METIRCCPSCGDPNIHIYAGLITGMYHCKQCGYIGPIVLEKDVEPDKFI